MNSITYKIGLVSGRLSVSVENIQKASCLKTRLRGSERRES